MRKAILVLVAVMSVAVSAWGESYGVFLTGSQETGGGDTDGLGFADVTLNGTTLTYSVLAVNINAPTAMHIHTGSRGVAGGVRVGLGGFTGSIARGTIEISTADADAIRANPSGFYLNIHNADFPAGAIRGQVQYAYYFPVVGRTPGVGGTNFITRLGLLNFTTFPTPITLEFFPQSVSGTEARSIISVPSLTQKGQLVIEDAPGPQVSGTGALKIFSDQRLDTTAEILNDQRASGQGTTGFSVEGSPLDEARTSGLLGMLSHASDADINSGVGRRTNIGFFNPQLMPVNATFSAYATNGALLGSVTTSINPGSQQQMRVFNLITSVTNTAQSNFYVHYTADAAIFVYASVVDNKTGDAVYVE